MTFPDMGTLRERVAAALAPRYAIEAEIGSGGTGSVYRVRDLRLDRTVAVKVLRPELATARSIERFRREQRTLASLNHPNILAIHDAEPEGGDGLMYYVMDFAPGETLARELERGPLPPARLERLVHDLLSALVYAHAGGVVHRDIKPSNIFCLNDRYLLGDFGIAHVLEASGEDRITGDGAQPGTLAYMAPEQLAGTPVGPAADLYAAGLVLYEAATGRHWPMVGDPLRADWRGVPDWLEPALQRALMLQPEERWPDAAAMLEAARPEPRSRLRWVVPAALLILLAAGARAMLAPSPMPAAPVPESDLALVPFQSAGGTGRSLAQFAAAQLEWYPRWSFRPFAEVLAWWDSAGAAADGLALRRVRARLVVGGQVLRGSGRDTVLLWIRDSAGRTLATPRIPGDSAHLVDWARAVADTVVRRAAPQYLQEFRELSQGGGDDFAAMRALVDGLSAFSADDWSAAESLYTLALERDPDFSRAAWEQQLLAIWRRTEVPPINPELLARLPHPYAPLLATMSVPNLKRREAMLAALADSYPANGRARLLLFDEQLHRGPLIGIPLQATLDSMRARAGIDPYLNQVAIYDHLLWGYTHLGDEAAARAMWQRRAALRAAHGTGPDTLGRLYDLARTVRFGGVKATVMRYLAARKYGANPRELAPYLRLGGTFDIPAFQRQLALAVVRARDPAYHPTAFVAQAMASFALGEPDDGFPALDSAAALFDTDEMRFQQLEWRLLPAALGLPLSDDASVVVADSALRPFMSPGAPLRTRAAWVSGVLAYFRDDTAALHAAQATMIADTAPGPGGELGAILGALALGLHNPDAALAATDTLFMADMHDAGHDPFARSVLHMVRARWQLGLGLRLAADSSLRWYESSDLRGWPGQEPQAGEVDQVLSVLTRLERGELLLGLGRAPEGCALLRRVQQLWRHAQPAFAPLLARAQKGLRQCR